MMDNIIEVKGIQRKTLIDKVVKMIFLGITLLCAVVIVLISLFIIVKGVSPFVRSYEVEGTFYSVNVLDFLTGLEWFVFPNIYGVGYIIINTVYITLLALIIAVPVSILSALVISKIAPKKIAGVLKSVIELLASIPSVIYGLFGLGFITIGVKNVSNFFGYQSAGGSSTLTAAIVLAIMIIPTITMVSVTALNAVSNSLIQGSLALGASKTQTNFKVVLTSAKSGIFSGIILGVGRALGEATAVSMVCGNAGSGPNFNPFDVSRTLTSTMFMGFHETTGMDYDIRFSVGIVLIFLILGTNLFLNFVKNRIGRKSGK